MAATAPALQQDDAAVVFPRRRRRKLGVYGLLVPAAILMGVALGYPLVRQFVISFQEYGLRQQFGQPAEWVGLQNYTDLLTDPYVWTVIGRSIAFCLVNAAVTMLVGVAFAVLMSRDRHAPSRITLQVALLLAWGTPVLASMTVWQWLFDSQYGVINWVLANVVRARGHGRPLVDHRAAVLLLRRDGHRRVDVRAVRRVLRLRGPAPGARGDDGGRAARRRVRRGSGSGTSRCRWSGPVLSIVLLLQVIWDFKVFTQIYVLQRAGAPTRETNLLGTLIYSYAERVLARRARSPRSCWSSRSPSPGSTSGRC